MIALVLSVASLVMTLVNLACLSRMLWQSSKAHRFLRELDARKAKAANASRLKVHHTRQINPHAN